MYLDKELFEEYNPQN